MKQYESYKDSGIEWLGKIPSHWLLSKGKHMFHLVTDNVSGPNLPKVALENIESGTGRYIQTSSDFMGEGVEFRENDILFGKLRPYLAKVYKAEFRGQSVGDIYVFRGAENQNADFLKFLMLSHPFISVVDGSTYGAKMPRANWDFISHLLLPNPPLPEQRLIATYLDEKVGQIDTVITEKEKMVEDLQGYRKSVITEAVTHGLNPDVPMKDSGIEWIGMIPEHWNCSKLKYYLSNPLQYGANESAESENREWPRYIRITDISDTGHLKDETFKSLDPEKATDYMLENDDILFARSGATVGKSFLFEEKYPACFAGYLIKAKCNKNILLPKYLYYFTCTNQYENWKNSIFVQATIQNIGADKYSTMPITVPPTIEEQEKIVTHIEIGIKDVDLSISELQFQIEDLKSYKSSLITEAVTGKIDLR